MVHPHFEATSITIANPDLFLIQNFTQMIDSVNQPAEVSIMLKWVA